MPWERRFFVFEAFGSTATPPSSVAAVSPIVPADPPTIASNAWGVFGQDGAVAAVRHALASGNLSHAYLITGPDGVGKRTLAYRLAQTLVSPMADDATVPDLSTRAARQIESDELPDIERIAISGICDESSHDHAKDNSTRIRICQVRRMERVASLAPYASPRRIFIVDTADQLQIDASHAILKTLEEPPANVLLLLLATDPDALLPTIRSRCQELPLHPYSHAALAEVLATDPDVTDPAGIARIARGRYGLARRMLMDPTLPVMMESVVTEAQRLARASRNERFDYAERLAQAWRQERAIVLQTIDLWRDWWRDVLVASSRAEADVSPEAAAEGAVCTPADALRAVRAVETARDHLLANTNPQLALEVMMLDLPVIAGPAPAGRETREPAAVG
ncbi:MAG: DNA polymerase III subunit [Chloroflexi bacterium]|nr:DNA polymerase III subunit [Chloroflexota bacterium]